MKQVLLVEDNMDERMLVKRFFKKLHLDAKLVTKKDGQEAIDFLETCQDLPGFVLLDIKMPRVDGHQVLQWIRAHEHTKLLPVIMFSTSDNQSDISHSYELGANGYVQKRVDNSDDLKVLSLFWTEVNKVA